MDAKWLSELEYAASALYDGGWRAEDKEQLIKEYYLDSEYTERICELLRRYAREA